MKLATHYALALLVGAVSLCAEDSQANAHDGRHHRHDRESIVGVWRADVTQVDCASGTPLLSFKRIDTYHAGGTLSQITVADPALRSLGVGEWRRERESRYVVRFTIASFLADGNLAAYADGTRSMKLSEDGTRLTSTTRTEVQDPQGQVFAVVCANDTAVPFE